MFERVGVTAKKSERQRGESSSGRQKGSLFQPHVLSVNSILFLQRTIGNHAVQRLFSCGVIQAKLKISQPEDDSEQEADRVAEQVIHMPIFPGRQHEPNPVSSLPGQATAEGMVQSRTKPLAEGSIFPLIQRQVGTAEIEENLIKSFMEADTTVQRKIDRTKEGKEGEEKEEEEEEKLIQAKSEPQVHRADLESEIHSLEGSGQPLPQDVRDSLEPRFGYDFNSIRVHTDNRAARAAQAVNAQAFTIGRNLVFGAGKYAPGTLAGDKLLAHELTHAIQQSQQPLGLQRRIVVNGVPYTPTTKYYTYLVNNFGEPMKEFIENMHNNGNPPDYTFSSYEQMGYEVRIRHQAIKGMEEVHSGCCGYFDSSHPDYLDSTYWDRLGLMHFKPKSPLPSGKEASDAIEAIFAPGAGTRLECLTMTLAIEYYSMLKGLGKAKFNAMFPGGSGIEISTSGAHLPLLSGTERKYKVIALSSKNELLPGDWVYFQNFSDYLIKHPGGYWQGENALYLGSSGGYRGFGLTPMSEAALNQELVTKYNDGLPDTDKKDVPALVAGGGGLLLDPVIRPEISKIVT